MKVKGKDFVQIPHEFLDEAHEKMDGLEQLVFIHLSRYAYSTKDIVYPTQAKLAELTGLSERTVIRKIKSLVEKKIITIISTDRNGIKWNTYRLTNWYNIKNIEVTQSHMDMTQSHMDMTQSHMDMTQSHMDMTQSHMDMTQSHMDMTDCHLGGDTKSLREVTDCHINNMNIITRSNNKNLAAEAAKDSESTEATDSLETREEQLKQPMQETDDTIEADEAKYLDGSGTDVSDETYETDEPVEPEEAKQPMKLTDYSTMDIKDVKNKIVSHFLKNYPTQTGKYIASLKNVTDEEMVRQAAAFLPYWEEHGWGNRSLGMLVTNMEEFVSYVEGIRWNQWIDWEKENQVELKNKFIFKHGLFNLAKEEGKLRSWFKSGNKLSGLSEAQLNWLTSKDKYFSHQGYAKWSEYGTEITEAELEELKDETIKNFFKGAF